MNYKVLISEMQKGYVEVNAETVEKAKEKALEEYDKGNVFWNKSEITEIKLENSTNEIDYSNERMIQDYRIINAVNVGESEFVLAQNTKALDSFVTWQCKNGNDYFWGHYIDNLLDAKIDFAERLEKAYKYIYSLENKKVYNLTDKEYEYIINRYQAFTCEIVNGFRHNRIKYYSLNSKDFTCNRLKNIIWAI